MWRTGQDDFATSTGDSKLVGLGYSLREVFRIAGAEDAGNLRAPGRGILDLQLDIAVAIHLRHGIGKRRVVEDDLATLHAVTPSSDG